MNPKTQRWLYIISAVIAIVGLIVFAEIRQANLHCKSIIVKLDEAAEYPFFTKQDILSLVTSNGSDPIKGTLCRKIDLRYVENIVQRNRLIKKCECSIDLAGNLVVNIKQHTPIARFFSEADSGVNALLQGGYITEAGTTTPLSSRFAARVPLISGKFLRNLKTEKSKQVLGLLKGIRENPFWKAQITELQVADDGEITLYTQVGNQEITFGSATDFEVKFEKLKIFYNSILPLKGWERYKKVSVKFKNQIVCE